MPKYVIERAINGIGGASQAELAAIAQKSCTALREVGPEVQWVHSYVTGDKVYCVYIAPTEDLIEEHARRGGFPAEPINAVLSMIDPTTAEG